MRIGVNTRFLLKNKLEGMGLFTLETLNVMVKNHPDDDFFFFFDRPYDDTFVLGKNVTPVVLFPPARHATLWVTWFELAIPRALEKYQCDVFFSPDNYLSLRTDVPTLLVVHDLAYLHFPEGVSRLNRWYYRFFIPRFLAKAKKIMTVSHFVKNDLKHFFPFTAVKTEVGYNGVRPIFKALPTAKKQAIRDVCSEGKPYFFYVGAIHPRKNIHRLIEAFDIFKQKTESDFKLLLAGRFAWQTGEVKSAYDNTTHKKDIVFLNYIDDETLAQYMAAAYALTYISLFEGFGVPLLEAMHCEIPVITADVSSMPEVIGKAGLTVNPTSIDAMSEAMIKLYESPLLYQNLVAEGIKQRMLFDWEKTGEQVYDSLKAMV